MMSDVPMISSDLISEDPEEKIVLKATHIPKGDLVNVIDLSAGLFYDDPDQGSNSPRRICLEFQARLGSGEKPEEPSLKR